MIWLFALLLFAGCVNYEQNLNKTLDSLGINKTAFYECKSQSLEKCFNKDKELANYYNVRGTPTFIINDETLVGARPLSDFTKIIDRKLENPGTRPNISLNESIWWGNPNASVVIIEFSSPNCPYCKRFHRNTYPELKKRYIDTGKVLWIFKPYVLGHGADEKEKIENIYCVAKVNRTAAEPFREWVFKQ